ncbi:MAG: hypothetical protein GY811_04740 [Myxococcales bacterium]|nr:hypothetical protein [Myxococcales bacterium]
MTDRQVEEIRHALAVLAELVIDAYMSDVSGTGLRAANTETDGLDSQG